MTRGSLTAPRFDLRVPVRFKGGRGRGEGIIWDVSTSGARIEVATARMRPGSQVHLQFSYSSEAEPIVAAAEVVRATETGFAVRFVNLSGAVRERLSVGLPRNTTLPRAGR